MLTLPKIPGPQTRKAAPSALTLTEAAFSYPNKFPCAATIQPSEDARGASNVITDKKQEMIATN
jgi:hypothetical protein